MENAARSLQPGAEQGTGPSRRQLVAALAVAAVGAGGDNAVFARKRKKKPQTRSVTKTFANDGLIRIPAQVDGIGRANPYPASINVAGFAGSAVRNVTVTLKDLSHEVGREVCVMLAKDTTNGVLMVKTGGFIEVPGVTLTFDDAAELALPLDTQLSSGRFQPTSNEVAADLHFHFTPPAPPPSGNSLLSAFRGLEADGSWRLYVADRVTGLDGVIAGGWELTITADMPQKRKKKKKR